jgi:NAD(P)-dependent dehydrogenase (short-subunit alcohol dehydrogenase family)
MGRRQAELDDDATEKLGTQARDIRAEASSLADLDTLYAQIQQEKGRVDALFVNARGGPFDGGTVQGLTSAKREIEQEDR